MSETLDLYCISFVVCRLVVASRLCAVCSTLKRGCATRPMSTVLVLSTCMFTGRALRAMSCFTSWGQHKTGSKQHGLQGRLFQPRRTCIYVPLGTFTCTRATAWDVQFGCSLRSLAVAGYSPNAAGITPRPSMPGMVAILQLNPKP